MSDANLPAILGGTPLWSGPPPAWPRPDPAVLEAMQAAFRENTWGLYDGPASRRLSDEIARLWEVPRVLPCASGTLAVEVCLRALGVGSGDEVAMSAYDYEGNFLSVLALGALPVLVDCRADDAQIDAALVGEALGPKTKAVLVSHLHGGLADVARVVQICRPRGVGVVEDAAQTPGGLLPDGRRCGTAGDLGVVSFGGSKLLSAGRGGAVLGNEPRTAQRAASILKRGVQDWAAISEMQACVLLPQFDRLDDDRAARSGWAARLREGCIGTPFEVMPSAGTPDFYKLGVFVPGVFNAAFYHGLRAEGFAVDPGWRPLHVGRSPSRYRAHKPLTNAEALPRRLLKLHHPIMLEGSESADLMAEALRRLYNHRFRLPPAPG